MILSHVRNEFLGCTGAITVQNEKELEEMKQFMGVEGLFTKEGNIARQMHCSKLPTTLYRDDQGMYITNSDADYLKSMHYNIYEYRDVCTHSEQLNFFGNENAPGIKHPDESLVFDPMEAEAKVVEEELSLDVILDYATVGTVTPASCDGLILENKDKIIEFIKKYDNIVVTKENYLELKDDVVSKFKDKIKSLKEENTRFNKEVTKNVKPFSDANLEVRKTIENVLKPLITNIETFEKEENERKKKELYNESIDPVLNMMVSKGLIDDNTKRLFQFNEKWTNASARTKKGNLTKKTTDEINAELNRICELYAQKQKDIETIKSTVENLSSAHGVDKDTLKADTYIDLYNNGVDMPGVQQRINADLENIKRAVEREKEKARIEADKKQREALQRENAQSVQNTVINEKVSESTKHEETFNLADEKTGEVIAMSNRNKIIAKRISTPEQLKGKTYTYVYEFSGDFGAIKTFSNVLKILSKISNFKYTRK